MASAINENAQLAQMLASLGTTLFGGPKTTNTATQTTSGGRTQTLVNPADILKLLTEEAGTGLASTLGQGAGAGIYARRKGIGTNALVLNDLLSRIGTKAAVAGAPTVTSPASTVTVTNQKAQGVIGGGSLGTLGTIGGLILASPSARAKVMEGVEGIFGKDIFSSLKKKGTGTEELPLTGDFPTTGGPLQAGPTMASYDGAQDITSLASSNFSTEDVFGNISTVVDGSGVGAVGSAIGDGFAAADYFGYTDIATGAVDGVDSFINSGFDSAVDGAVGSAVDSAIDGASSGIDGATGGAFGGVPVVGIINALSDGKVTGKEVASLGGAYAGAQIGTAIFPGIGTVIGGIIGGLAGDSCFITTAILKTHGSENHQHPMLQVLRRYRDTWLKENHPEDIVTYYEIAPKIVDAINLCMDSEQVWKNLYAGFLIPAIHCIEHGDNAGAYELYRNMVMAAKEYAYG